MRSSFRRVPVSLALAMAGILGLSLAGCGGSSTPVTRPTLTVTAANASRVYGVPNPVFTASASGALSGDTFTLTASTVATPFSPVGIYSIVLSATITGFVNGDTQTVVTGLPALTTTATSSSPAGSYPIVATLGTLAAANYSFTFGTGA